MRPPLLALAAVLALAGAAQAQAQAQPAAGEAEFKAEGCTACHVPGEYDQAPPLAGVFGRKIAGAPDWPYCDALKAHKGSWDDASLDAFLKDTQAFAPGCTMTYKIADPAKRAALIGYLKTLK